MSTPDADAPTPVADLSYEQARDELVRLVSRIESGQVPLEESMLLWERGEELAAHCQAKLDAAQSTLDRATGEGEPVAQAAPDGDGTTDPAPDARADQPDAAEGSSAGT
ncbi:exodeoxyribonuclease VII small subunit [Ornithinimicrobium sufpigmenti]|uniref:exodeoxyribonuclease VII small subunit n=1 Tax=Ornithinimicrobium sufpigmenti TaxID=2508882 RepID=UPI0010368D16|nr:MULTISPECIES: exodeoxyribonuclease VII small subunit [unclassified Ornithinimicrobium]